jgi:arsenate reductase (glutaredoxin)
MITVYGLRACDTCRKALKWLKDEGIDHRFHDMRADGLDRAVLVRWIEALGWETLLNRRGTTWRQLPETEKKNLDEARAVSLMLAHPALIKRPVFDLGQRVTVGFGKAEQDTLRATAAV